ncbi:MAG: histidine ammonia-lyase [Anaerolineaceae bacterium]
MIELDGNNLTLSQILAVARNGEKVKISEKGRESILKAREWLEDIVKSGRPVYGINTGFGIFSDRNIQASEAALLSRNLIISHAVGTGEFLPDEVVRAAMLVRANTLTKGHSGVRIEIIQTLVDMLNLGVTPKVPSQGSLGSSGDLGPLSHMALVFTTDDADREEESGFADFMGNLVSGKEAMARAGLKRLKLGAKEGLAINNGASFSAALAAMAIEDAWYLLDLAEYCLALSLEAMVGCSTAFDARLHEVRGYDGQIKVAANVRSLTSESTLIDSTGRIQDAYSLRCAPQVQGAARETLNFVASMIAKEVNAATDNPLLFGSEGALSGGNFHGEPIAMVMDFLGIAMTEVGAISERRIYRLTDGKMNAGLPPMLVDNHEAAGLNSGLMMLQYTAASLTLENQSLATSDAVLSLPTSGGQEDHNANSMTAARHAKQIIDNVTHILCVELYTAARAVDLRLRNNPDLHVGKGSRQIYEQIRKTIPYQAGDSLWGAEVEILKKEIKNRRISVSLKK